MLFNAIKLNLILEFETCNETSESPILKAMSRILIKDGPGIPVVENVLIAESLRDRMRGLLGRTGLDPELGMLLRPCKSIHMWFMRFPIDAAFLDQNLQVLKMARNLRPWQLAFAPRATTCVLETAAGVLDRVQQGDTLILE
ncbi:DUF192 domain-containing protein [Verrucomicrobia bacterium S94]|nr:DUF192 domain-containing protein [Verrucomicrobia bacterium S94]